MSPKLRASLDDGRYRPKDPWVYAYGKTYRVIGDRVHVLYVRKGMATADFVLRSYFRTIPRVSNRYREVMTIYRKRCKCAQGGQVNKIDKGVPIPTKVTRKPSPQRKYDFYEFQVGDSQFYPNVNSRWLASRAGNTTKRTGFRFTVRKLIEKGVPGTRIWRVR